jgi:outer membrane protein assembly factor BamB
MTLLDREGAVLREDIDVSTGFVVDPETGTLAITSETPSVGRRTTFLGRGPDVVLDGRLVDVPVDDGSVPGLLLLDDGDLQAYDQGSRAPRWSVAQTMAGSAIVVRGRVYLSTVSGLVAVDGRTGEELWHTPQPESRTLGALVTDGVHLLSAQQRPDAAGEVSQDDWPGVGELAAYAFDDGRELWRVDLPEDFLGVWPSGSTLVGWGPGRSAVLG